MFLPTISPHDANVVLEHCDMTGAYISLDAGLSWRMFNLRGVASAFAFDPKDRNVIYASGSTLSDRESRVSLRAGHLRSGMGLSAGAEIVQPRHRLRG
jgi:hypothetical protein